LGVLNVNVVGTSGFLVERKNQRSAHYAKVLIGINPDGEK